jgi:multidrug efflux pump subunit AcrA (membrane-fusion protein)
MYCWLGVPFAALLLTAGGWAYLTGRQAQHLADPAKARSQGRPIPVRSEIVASKTIEDVIGATGVTIPSQTAWLQVGPSELMREGAPATPLIVKKVHVHEGDFVRKGQVVCEFEDKAYIDLRNTKQAALEAATATLDLVKEQIKYNQRVRELNLLSAREGIKYRTQDEENRNKECDIYHSLSQKGAASLIGFYEAQSKLFAARFEAVEAKFVLERNEKLVKVGLLIDKQDLTKAVSDLQKAQVDLQLAELDVGRLKIVSPIDGFLTYENSVVALESSVAAFDQSLGSGATTGVAPATAAKPAVEPVPGQILSASSTMGEVLKLQPIDLLVDFPLERIDDVRIGQPAEVVLDSFPKDTFAGTVLRIGPKVNPQVRVMPVLVRIENSNARIKPGITGFVRTRVTKQALTVPGTAVLHQSSKAMVFRVRDGRAHICPVRTGPTIENDVVEITNGLSPGDEVVVFQNFYRHSDELVKTDCYLNDNDLVDVDWKKWTGRHQ